MRFSHSLALLLLIGLTVSSCSRVSNLESQRLNEPIKINGERLDWVGKIVNIEGQFVRVGAVNDSEFLYLALMVSNRALVGQILNKGLVFWINQGKKKERTNGFRYPIGMEASGGMDASELGKLDLEGRQLQLEMALREVELLSEPGIGRRYEREGLKNIRVETDSETGIFFLEMKIPLRAEEGGVYEVGSDPGETINIFIEVPDLDIGASYAIRQGDGAYGGSSGPGGFSSAGRRTNRGHMTAPGGVGETLSEVIQLKLAN